MRHRPTDLLQSIPLNGVFDAVSGPLWVKAPDGVYVLVNDAFLYEFCVSSSAIIGQCDKNIAWGKRTRAAFAHDAWVASIGRVHHSVESMRTRGKPRLWGVTITPLMRPNKGIVGTVGAAVDVAMMCHDLQVYTEIEAATRDTHKVVSAKHLPIWATPFWSSPVMDVIKSAYQVWALRPSDLLVNPIDLTPWLGEGDKPDE